MTTAAAAAAAAVMVVFGGHMCADMQKIPGQTWSRLGLQEDVQKGKRWLRYSNEERGLVEQTEQGVSERVLRLVSVAPAP